MVAMPYFLLGSFGFLVYRQVKAAQKQAALSNPTLEQGAKSPESDCPRSL
jgi:hypothetical protein